MSPTSVLGSFWKCLEAGLRVNLRGSFLLLGDVFLYLPWRVLYFSKEKGVRHPDYTDVYLIDLWGGVENIYSHKCSEDIAY